MNTVGQPARLQVLVTKLVFLLSLGISFSKLVLYTTMHACVALSNKFTISFVFHFLVVIENSVQT